MALVEHRQSSRTTLWRIFKIFFRYFVSPADINKILPVLPKGQWVLGMDGMWFHRLGVVMIYRDVSSGVNFWWSFPRSESYNNLSEDFYRMWLLTHQHLPSGLVSDWKGSLVALSGAFFPNTPHQRCLAHLVALTYVWGKNIELPLLVVKLFDKSKFF